MSHSFMWDGHNTLGSFSKQQQELSASTYRYCTYTANKNDHPIIHGEIRDKKDGMGTRATIILTMASTKIP